MESFFLINMGSYLRGEEEKSAVLIEIVGCCSKSSPEQVSLHQNPEALISPEYVELSLRNESTQRDKGEGHGKKNHNK